MRRFSLGLASSSPLWMIEAIGVVAERYGFDGVWLSEHLGGRSSIVAASHLLGRLRRIWVGLGVLNPYLFNPLNIAQVAATLSELAANRVLLGIGAGDKTSLSRAGIVWRHPLRRVEEAVERVRALLEAENLLGFKPATPIPIYLGAQGPRMLRLAGRIGDGVLVNYSDVEELRWVLEEVRKGVEEAGRSMSELDVAAYPAISIDEDEKKALKTAAPYAAYILSGASKTVLERLGVDSEIVGELKILVKRGRWREIPGRIPAEYVRRTVFVGRAEQLREYILQLLKMGYTHIVFGAPFGPRVLTTLKTIESIIRDLKKLK